MPIAKSIGANAQKGEAMSFTKKLTTLIRATVRGAIPSFSHPKTSAEKLAQLRRDLAAMEAKERELAELLKKTRREAQTAAEAGDIASAQTKNRLAAKLEAQLDAQSVRAITLSENVNLLEKALKQSVTEKSASAETTTPTETTSDSPPPIARDDDLSARKSRLSE